MEVFNLADYIREKKPPEILEMEKLARDLAKASLDKVDDEGLILEIMDLDKEQFTRLIRLYFTYGICKRSVTFARNKEGFDKEELEFLEEQYELSHSLLERSGMNPEEL